MEKGDDLKKTVGDKARVTGGSHTLDVIRDGLLQGILVTPLADSGVSLETVVTPAKPAKALAPKI